MMTMTTSPAQFRSNPKIAWALILLTISVSATFVVDTVLRKYSYRYDDLRASVSWGHMAVAVAVAVASCFAASPYGRHTKPAAASGEAAVWTLPASLSWALQESPTLFAFLYFNLTTGGGAIRANPATLLFATHYVNRTIVWPMLLGRGTPQQVWVTFSALTYCIFNGVLQNAVDVQKESAGSPPPPAALSSLLSTSMFSRVGNNSPALALVGVAVFAGGMWANITADRYLVSLKEQSGGKYMIPRHFLFSVVSCPNFFYEAVEWLGFALCTAGCCGLRSSNAVAAFSFFVFTMANTFPRAYQHHRWYHEKFGDEYKKLKRAAVIPFLL